MNEIAVLVLRVAFGGLMIAHGYPKLRHREAEEMWRGLGVPVYVTRLVAVLEFFGGILVAVGLLTSLLAVFFAVLMIGTAYAKKAKLHLGFLTIKEQGYDFDILIFAVAVFLLLTGDGELSLATLLWV